MKNFKRFSIQAPVAVMVAVAAGVLMLFTYIFPLDGLRAWILNIVMIGAATALVIGVFNLLSVHVKKIRTNDKPAASLLLVSALVFTFIVTLLQAYTNLYPDWLPGSQWLLTNIQLPVESALMGVLAVTLVYAAARLIIHRPNGFSVLFVATVLVTLMASTQFLLGSSLGALIRNFVSHGLASGGARGILIGVALGTIATGLRILMGVDRPYGG
ncbi:hypothetical protein KQH61_04810 [bacterium]|nr:hypothetical protein [bacterium]MCB2179222.1 hypothetical protein [bacterium]